jgi:hypothetical protein
MQSRNKGTSHVQQNEGRLSGLVTHCVGTALYNTFFKEKGRKDNEEGVSS